MERVTVLLAEDHAVVREGTREMLAHDPAIVVVGEATDGPSAVALAAELRPDVVLLDMALPGFNGIEATRQIRSGDPPTRVLILSAYDDEDYVLAAMAAGASGYILKTAHINEVMAALHAVAAGDVVLGGRLAAGLLARPGTGRDVLTSRELQILRLAAKGSHNKEIAAFLALSTRTVEAHLTSIFNKLGVSTRTEAIVQAAARGWLTLERDALT